MPAALSSKVSNRHEPTSAQVHTFPVRPAHEFASSFFAAQDEAMSPKKGSSSNDSSTGTTPTKAKPKPWTGAELKVLFQHAIKHGAPGSDKGWEGVVPGRTGQQARNAWRFNVVPNVSKYLERK